MTYFYYFAIGIFIGLALTFASSGCAQNEPIVKNNKQLKRTVDKEFNVVCYENETGNLACFKHW